MEFRELNNLYKNYIVIYECVYNNILLNILFIISCNKYVGVCVWNATLSLINVSRRLPLAY